MNPHYNQDYTMEQVEAILDIIQDCVKHNHYTISRNENRKENNDFIKDYNLTSGKQKDILLKIVAKDFCHSLQNMKIGFEHETLYVFCPQILLFNFDGVEELIDIYTKFNIIEYELGKRVVAISFHKRNKPLEYLFR